MGKVRKKCFASTKKLYKNRQKRMMDIIRSRKRMSMKRILDGHESMETMESSELMSLENSLESAIVDDTCTTPTFGRPELTPMENVLVSTVENNSCTTPTFVRSELTPMENFSLSSVENNRSTTPTIGISEFIQMDNVLVSTEENNNTTASFSRGKSHSIYSKKKKKKKHKTCYMNAFHEESPIENGGEERRIVDIHYYTKSLLRQISKHSPFDCGAESIDFHSEHHCGLTSKIFFKCKMCHTKFFVHTCDPKPKCTLDLNTAAVSGMTVSGIGHAQFSELLAAMNLPQMPQNVYDTTNRYVSKEWELTASKVMAEAAEREREAAIKEGRVKNGVAVIDVIADGCWGKRTYKKNYSSLSGAAAIVGRQFGEVLFLGVKNKYCSICARASNKNVPPKHHTCYKNYEGPSTGMESDIIVEGFKHSLDMYNIIYGRMIGDGDCSTYNKILEARPYNNVTVEKLECKNHLLRNMCNKLSAVASDTRYPLAQRKLVSTQRILAMRKAICLAIKESAVKSSQQPEVINILYKDICNSCNHAFGQHDDCRQYYCKSEKKSENIVPKLRASAIWNKIQYVVSIVASNSRSLVNDVTSNKVECFNSVIAKLIAGKRINFSQRQTYQTRCNAAVVSFNTKKPVYTLQKNILGFSPKCKSKLLEERRLRKNLLSNKCVRRKIRCSIKASPDKNYGEGCEKPDLSVEEFERLKETFMVNLKKSEEEIKKIERATVLQRDCSEWLELRRQLLTASNFGKIVKKRNSTNATLVKSLLYKRDLSHVSSIKHGVENESKALNQLSAQLNIEIKPCGLFIDEDIPYLGATPDGLIDDDRIVEIKCPVSVLGLEFKEAIRNKKLAFYKLSDSEPVINKNHDWFYQAQGQLHIAKRKTCVLGIWMGEDRPLHVELIEKDSDFFFTKMLPKLKIFYFDHILPELLDPRHTRNLPLRGLPDPNKLKENISSLNSESELMACEDAFELCIGMDSF